MSMPAIPSAIPAMVVVAEVRADGTWAAVVIPDPDEADVTFTRSHGRTTFEVRAESRGPYTMYASDERETAGAVPAITSAIDAVRKELPS